MVKIFIDPGHGGTDPGAVGNGLLEKNLNLKIARKISQMLVNEYEGVSVRMSRTGDQTVSLSERTNNANSWNADFYLSIHINAGGGTGFESYVYTTVPTRTKNLQKVIHEEVLKQVDFRNRGMKQANFHVLRETKMDALLTENGFIDRSKDANLLKNDTFLEKIARGHVNGLVKAFQLKKKQTPLPPSDGEAPQWYKVQIGAFRIKKNAEALAERAKKAGFDVFIVKE
ncbi:N-acetylmuramoyl-L-alanine amidase [Fervidibacillus halotolerans]|uniref:N-acetylmuramoyl-L-alanine amidase n=1 Tax=Fervidibacillus halotolerans TaxID=2980027 RepID=A0A9E8RY29_9BACI|nr:N-acetylmuramoyl-L-alanine amidase [Fervidibacillus halotolerans]WAA11804.1 N-acetylmuramoyl-L-alanine amidase [Fervidibacillus halotolerans]